MRTVVSQYCKMLSEVQVTVALVCQTLQQNGHGKACNYIEQEVCNQLHRRQANADQSPYLFLLKGGCATYPFLFHSGLMIFLFGRIADSCRVADLYQQLNMSA